MRSRTANGVKASVARHSKKSELRFWKWLHEREPRSYVLFLIVTLLPVLIGRNLWLVVWYGIRPCSWDGAGHFAIAKIYDQTIFPDTFGWTNAYFGGMPVPNFYPPLFYWLVALLHHSHLFSFETAFKLVMVIPVLLIPAAMWLLGWTVSAKSRLIATAVALACVPLLADARFISQFPAGLDYFSTFQIGLYTQPLGFVLMAVWFAIYLNAHERRWKFALASILLALTILANFFNAITAVVFIAATLISDSIHFYRAADEKRKSHEKQALLSHLLSPFVSLGLAAFWLFPMLSQYEYFVTRPFFIETGLLIPTAMWGWYALAVVGGVLWLRRPSRASWPYLGTCLSLALVAVFATTLGPRWFPLQSPRFLATLNFLLAVPVGHALAAAFCGLARVLGEINARTQTLTLRQARLTTVASLLLLLLLALTSPGPRWAYAFYPEGKREGVDDVLGFARHHRDGRYLVEVINPVLNPAYTEASFDARALSSYLGAQGNEVLSTVFHEASPNALFTLPVTNAFSNYFDSFGISSVLADDLDFHEQPLERHLERARFLGIRYLVIRTPRMKERVAQLAGIGERYDFGWWSVFEVPGAPLSARALAYRPALVVSDLNLKQRRRNEWSFIRMVEEQFADGWFDVLLARSPENRIEHLPDLEQFGALILDSYVYEDENLAFQRLKVLAQNYTLILLSSDDPLFKRISAVRAEFPRAVIIDRAAEEPGEILEAVRPTFHFQNSSIRREWAAIRQALESSKVSSGISSTGATTQQGQNSLRLDYREPAIKAPVLIPTTYHPNWQREDEGAIYAATPFYMLTFAREPVLLNYKRSFFDIVGLGVSTASLILCSLLVWQAAISKRA